MSRLGPHALLRARVYLALSMSAAACGDTAGDSVIDHPTSSTSGGELVAPPPPRLLAPADGAEDVPIQTELCWTQAAPEGRVRYRVFVDGIELSQGKVGDEGFVGTCTGPLALEHDRVYAWSVVAVDEQDHTLQSPPSETWSFRTAWDGDSRVLFEDDFSSDKGWLVGGTAVEGHWVRGNPVKTTVDGALAQPDDCAGGQDCFFTGQNPDADPNRGDVDGGSVQIVSPEFDASGARSLTISLSRFFFRSDFEQTGAYFEVELLVPDPTSPDGYRAHVLERLDNGDDARAANTWTPTAHAACGIDLVAGSRLRVTAFDPGIGVVEAAIDDVVVTGHKVTDNCSKGVGALCSPGAPDTCDEGLLCCPHGVVNHGIHRCSEPVPAIDVDDPPPDPDAPDDGPLGCDAPDLVVVAEGMKGAIEELFVDEGSCLLIEGCVGGPGVRKVLRFDTITANVGSKDLTLGVPSNHLDLFHYSQCHDHYHFDGYARYELRDLQGNVVAPGHKQAFCLLDWESWAWPELEGYGESWNGADATYSCFNQGISRGWQDTYEYALDCQWVDITDVPAGDYVLRIEVNLPQDEKAVPTLVERDYSNNTLEVPVTLP